MESPIGHILVVDDDKDIQQFIQQTLESVGHRVTTCSSAPEALELLAPRKEGIEIDHGSAMNDGEFDLIFTDMNMPGMSGLALVKNLKEMRPEIPVVMITAYGTIESAVEAMRMGAYDFITK